MIELVRLINQNKSNDNMITFNDLKFVDHPYTNGKLAIHFFENGYGISVIKDLKENEDYDDFSVAILKKEKDNWNIDITKTLEFANNYVNINNINKLIIDIQSWGEFKCLDLDN